MLGTFLFFWFAKAFPHIYRDTTVRCKNSKLKHPELALPTNKPLLAQKEKSKYVVGVNFIYSSILFNGVEPYYKHLRTNRIGLGVFCNKFLKRYPERFFKISYNINLIKSVYSVPNLNQEFIPSNLVSNYKFLPINEIVQQDYKDLKVIYLSNSLGFSVGTNLNQRISSWIGVRYFYHQKLNKWSDEDRFIFYREKVIGGPSVPSGQTYYYQENKIKTSDYYSNLGFDCAVGYRVTKNFTVNFEYYTNLNY